MEVDGYKLLNLDEFDALNVPQAYYSKNFDLIGIVNFMICRWDQYGVAINGEIIFPGVNGVNPFPAKKNVIYIDEDRNVWWGLLDEN